MASARWRSATASASRSLRATLDEMETAQSNALWLSSDRFGPQDAAGMELLELLAEDVAARA
jgi:hypothetical protein